MKTILSAIAFLIFLPFSSWASSDPIQPEIIIFENSQGKVTLKHTEHSELKGVKCIACHHRYIRAKPAGCLKCHPRTALQKNEKFSKVLMKDALHKCCLDCHKMTSEGSFEKPPLKCNDCHKQVISQPASK